MEKKEVQIVPLFTMPVMSVILDLDLEKLTEFVIEIQNKNRYGISVSNKGGWHSGNILNEDHEEFNKLKQEITQALQAYYSEVFTRFNFKQNVTPILNNMWANVNHKYHYNDWHDHVGSGSIFSGSFYVKHDGSVENGVIAFKNPNRYISLCFPHELQLTSNNEMTAEQIDFPTKGNRLLIFPSWLEHKVEANLKDNIRISFSFNSTLHEIK